MGKVLVENLTTESGDSCRWWRLALLEGWVNGLRRMKMGRKAQSPVTIFSGDSSGVFPVVVHRSGEGMTGNASNG